MPEGMGIDWLGLLDGIKQAGFRPSQAAGENAERLADP
jgi:hypothetical protein